MEEKEKIERVKGREEKMKKGMNERVRKDLKCKIIKREGREEN